MARPKSNAGKSKSDVVRDYLRTHSTASVSEIVNDLKPYGISLALAQKIKYKDGGKRARRARKPRRTRAARAFASSELGGGASKADAIRRVARGMGKRVRPRDVIAALREEGTSVSFAQVGQVLKSMGMRRRRRRRGAGARRRAASSHSPTISLEALMAAKKLADQLGGVQAAKQAMDALARLS